ncbi:MAG: methylmalonyl-CoA carboxyltransferase [Bacteroidetes bacterium]|nr:MAG: methylmalonyl-CoA carboxyltransferase [Bacteroidota bacterium]
MSGIQESKIRELVEKRAQARLGGGEKKIASQHDKGKYTARERIQMLVDEGSFEEFDAFVTHRCEDFGMEKSRILGDGVVTGHGTIDGRVVYVYSQDFTIYGGSLSLTCAEKICKIMDMAMKNGAPVIGIMDSGGARIQEGVKSLMGYSMIFQKNIEASGVIPQISMMMGPSAGGAVYSPALTDFILMNDQTSNMFVTGPKVVKTVTGEQITAENLGGARMHSTKSGVAAFMSKSEEEAFEMIRKLFQFIPQNNLEEPPRIAPTDSIDRLEESLNTIIPEDANKPYNVMDVIAAIVDNGDFFEVHATYAKNIVVGFARMDGMPVGIVANQPKIMAGVLDINASRKGARFVRFCDAFNIPIITLEDVPGFLPGSGQESNGIIMHGAKLLFAYGEATVPKITVILRKAYGGAYIVMSSKGLKSDINYAWPSAEIAVMGPSGAIEILYGKELKELKDDPEKYQQFVNEKETEYKEKFANPYVAASLGYLDDVIEPRNTRFRIIRALNMLQSKKDMMPPKKHSNLPL